MPDNSPVNVSDIFYRDKYPVWIVLVSNAVSLAMYAIGAYIMFRAGIVFFFLYLVYIAWMESRLLVGSCAGCYYYGKRCAFGKGRIACLVTKKRETGAFDNKQVTWKSMIPDLLVTVIPLVTAVVLMIINFSWVLLALTIILVILTSAGNAYVRGKLACKYCAQRELGCPAEKLFDKAKAEQKS